MITRRAFVATSLFSLGAVYLPIGRRAHGQTAPQLLIIVGPSLAGQSIGLGTLRNAYQGYPTDFHGRRLVPFHYPTESVERARFDKMVLGLAPDQAARFWIDQRVRRGAQPPRSIGSPELMLKVVASLSGAIGYVTLDAKRVPPPLRILPIDGEEPQGSIEPL